jgi:Domain of unknown function (DUF2019)
MAQKSLDRLSDEELVLEFAKWAKEYGASEAIGNLQRSTQAYTALEAVDDELRTRGLAARSRLLPLLDHADMGIRYYAALWLLPIAPASARAILDEIAADFPSPVSAQSRGSVRASDGRPSRPN